MTALSREWGKRLSAEDDPRPALSDELYGWVDSEQCPAAQSPEEVAVALCDLVEWDAPQLARQSGAAAVAYVATALRDVTRDTEFAHMRSAFRHDTV